MKTYLILNIILMLVSCSVSKPPVVIPVPPLDNKPKPPSVKAAPYIYNWITIPKEPNVINYKIQQSINSSNWTTITTINPQKIPDNNNNYSFKLPQPTYSRYYRILATMTKGTYTTTPIFVQVK